MKLGFIIVMVIYVVAIAMSGVIVDWFGQHGRGRSEPPRLPVARARWRLR